MHHFPKFIRSRELSASSLQDVSLLLNTAMLKLELDVCQPWLRTSGIAEDILLVNRIFLGLHNVSSSSSCDLVQLTIKYKSGFPRESFDLETRGAAIVGRSSPGILCLLVEVCDRKRNTKNEGWEGINPRSRVCNRGRVLKILACWPCSQGTLCLRGRRSLCVAEVGSFKQLLTD